MYGSGEYTIIELMEVFSVGATQEKGLAAAA
jgi:hypothetical protein